MKKSKQIMLSFVCAGALLVAGCDDANSNEGKVVSSVAECVKVTGNSETWCKTQYDQAKADNDKNAPTFASKASCAEQFGEANCQTRTTSSGSSVFVPAMMGFMVGQMMNNNNGGGYGMAPSAPIYRSVNGNSYTAKSYATRTPVSSFSSRSSVSSGTSRGGFGGSAHSSFGG